jgi:pyruvate dehydrogenase E1 component alpha subunit
MEVQQDKLLDMYRMMVRIRTFEERVAKEFATGKMPGFVHLYTGEEAVAAGACATLRPDDYITSTHRGHGHLIAKGGRTDRMMAELWGRKTGYNKGKGGSMHIADIELGILGANGIVGAGIPIAAGAALSCQMDGNDRVTVCFFSDGATNTTRFHEGVNLAAVWNLPVVFVIENNMYANSTRIADTCKLTNLSDRACAYGIPGISVDGNDVLAVYEAVEGAVARARKGDGPSLVECKTYRWRGHHQGDTPTYRTKDEENEWKKKDPIARFRDYLFQNSILTDNEADKIQQEMDKEMEVAVQFAIQSPLPEPEELLEDVYA